MVLFDQTRIYCPELLLENYILIRIPMEVGSNFVFEDPTSEIVHSYTFDETYLYFWRKPATWTLYPRTAPRFGLNHRKGSVEITRTSCCTREWQRLQGWGVFNFKFWSIIIMAINQVRNSSIEHRIETPPRIIQDSWKVVFGCIYNALVENAMLGLLIRYLSLKICS